MVVAIATAVPSLSSGLRGKKIAWLAWFALKIADSVPSSVASSIRLCRLARSETKRETSQAHPNTSAEACGPWRKCRSRQLRWVCFSVQQLPLSSPLSAWRIFVSCADRHLLFPRSSSPRPPPLIVSQVVHQMMNIANMFTVPPLGRGNSFEPIRCKLLDAWQLISLPKVASLAV